MGKPSQLHKHLTASPDLSIFFANLRWDIFNTNVKGKKKLVNILEAFFFSTLKFTSPVVLHISSKDI